MPKVDCEWSTWGQWSSCSKTCGHGSQWRKRTIVTNAENGGKQCDGSSEETKTCLEGLCPGTLPNMLMQVLKKITENFDLPTKVNILFNHLFVYVR